MSTFRWYVNVKILHCCFSGVTDIDYHEYLPNIIHPTRITSRHSATGVGHSFFKFPHPLSNIYIVSGRLYLRYYIINLYSFIKRWLWLKAAIRHRNLIYATMRDIRAIVEFLDIYHAIKVKSRPSCYSTKYATANNIFLFCILYPLNIY